MFYWIIAIISGRKNKVDHGLSSYNQQVEEEEEAPEEGSEYDPNEEEESSEEEEEGEFIEEEEGYGYEPDDIDEPPQQVRQRKKPSRRVLQEEPSIKSSKTLTPAKKRKPVEVSKPSQPPVKRTKVKHIKNETVEQTPSEVSIPTSSPPPQTSIPTNETPSNQYKKPPVIFNDGNVDVNLYTSEAQQIVKKKIKISSSLIVCSQIIDNWDNKNFNSEYASITIQRKLKDGKAFEFNIPLNLAYSLQNAIQIIIDSNPKFFSGIKRPKNFLKKDDDEKTN